MSDISQSSQATLSQALTRLSELAPASPLANQGVDVLVKHLAGNVLSLSKSPALLNKPVLIPKPDIKGTLAAGQTHQLKLSLENSPSLTFFSPTAPKVTNTMALSEQQIQSLLRLPARQLVSNNVGAKPDVSNKLSVINATVLSVTPKTSLNANQTHNNVNPQATKHQAVAKNSNATNQHNILRVSLTDQRPPVEVAVTLTAKPSKRFAEGEKVTFSMAPKGNNWQLTIAQAKTPQASTPQNTSGDRVQLTSQVTASALPNTSAFNKIASQLLQQTSEALPSAQTSKASTETQVSTSPKISVTKDHQSILSPLLAVPLIKASLSSPELTQPITFDLPIKPVLQQLSKINNEQNQTLIQKLHSLLINRITLQIKPSGEIDLLVQSTQPVASIAVTKEMAQALAPLKLPNQQALIKLLGLSADTNKPNSIPAQSTRADLNVPVQKLNTMLLQNITTDNNLKFVTPSVDGSKSPEIRLSMKEATANLLAVLQQKLLTSSVISPDLLANKSEQISLVHSLLRIVKARAEAPAMTLQSIEKALSDVEFFKGSNEQSSKQIIAQVLQQIKQALPQGKEQDANQIRQLLTAPALNLSALQMINPTASQGFMSGLVTLLQMSLSARLSRDRSSRAEHITSTLNDVLGNNTSKVKPKVTSKAMGELSQLEQKHQLMKEISRLFSGHQTNKLGNVEQMIQGQETFYYNLPSVLGGAIKDVELLIKREENTQENASADKKANKTWQLTMKLSVGELGELLTKAKLRSDTLEINFYASNETVKIQVMNYLPLLRKKLDSLGIEVSKSHCQLGKIPDTLQPRPYHMFQAKA